MPKQIIIVTTGQPSTNPRMVKEYQALKRAGYKVTVLYSYWVDWAEDTDKVLFKNGDLDPKDFVLTGGSPHHQRWKYFLSRVIHKASYKLCRWFPAWFNKWAISRPSFFLYLAVQNRRADMYIGHNLGALYPVVNAASKFRSLSGFDLEDFYSGQYDSSTDSSHAIALYLEKKYIPLCNFLLAASPLIANAYEALISRNDIAVINNVFSKSFLQPVAVPPPRAMRLFWFSQTVGRNRGLETIIKAINLLPECDICFDVMGSTYENYVQELYTLINRKEALRFLPPVPADSIFGIAATYDIGMAAEVPHNANRDICLTNKLFVYLTAGNCILASDTKAQQLFLKDHPLIGFLYKHDDPAELSTILKSLYDDPVRILNCRKNALQLAETRYNWEYEEQLLLQQLQTSLN